MQFQLSKLLSTLLQGGKDCLFLEYLERRVPCKLINCPFSLQCFTREILVLSEGDFQLGWLQAVDT